MIEVIIFGGGKFAGNIVDDFSNQISAIGYIDTTGNTFIKDSYGIKFFGSSFEQLLKHKKICRNIVLGVGSEGDVEPKRHCFLKIKDLAFDFPAIIHESAIVSKKALIGEGSIVQSNSVIQANVKIGANTIISANAFIGHDSMLSDHIFIGPGVNIGGSVTINETTHIGIGACVIQKISIGKKCLIGASSCVIRDVPDNSKVLGVPGNITKF